jgi:hypothetical protein
MLHREKEYFSAEGGNEPVKGYINPDESRKNRNTLWLKASPSESPFPRSGRETIEA